MATALNPFNRIKLLFQSLAGNIDKEFDDEEGYDKNELAALEEMSGKSVSDIVEKHGKQTMVVDDDKEEKDRLGIKKPKKSDMPQQQSAKTVKKDENQQSIDEDEQEL